MKLEGARPLNSVKLSTFDNGWYNPGRGLLARMIWYFVNVAFFQNPWNPLSTLKIMLLRLFGAKIGHGVVIKPSINIKYPWLLEVGNHVWIGEKVWIDNLERVIVGDNVCISQGALLLTGNHDYTKEAFDLIVRETIIERGAWIGARAIVCPGVIVASHTVISAGSVITRNTEPYLVYQGNPARIVKERILTS